MVIVVSKSTFAKKDYTVEALINTNCCSGTLIDTVVNI